LPGKFIKQVGSVDQWLILQLPQVRVQLDEGPGVFEMSIMRGKTNIHGKSFYKKLFLITLD
jgi:hypothetical protein